MCLHLPAVLVRIEPALTPVCLLRPAATGSGQLHVVPGSHIDLGAKLAPFSGIGASRGAGQAQAKNDRVAAIAACVDGYAHAQGSQKVSLVPGQVVAMHPMAVHGVAPNTTAHPRTTLYYRLVVRGRVAGRTICNTDMYADPWCEMPVMRGVH